MARPKDVKDALAKTPETKPQVNTLGSLLKSVNIKSRFEDILGKRASSFTSSIISVTNQNKLLKTADPMTIISAASVAASLDLSVVPALGLAHIVPYRDKKSGKVVAQFQMGWRGYVQLAQRTGLYETMNAGKLYEGQIVKKDLLTGKILVNEDGKISDEVVGYFAHFELLNGFKKTAYIPKEDAIKHGKRYSKSFETGLWTKDTDAMGIKTIIKALLGKWAPLSSDYQMQKALELDQAIIKDDGTPEYIDNEPIEAEITETVEEAPNPERKEIEFK